MAYQGIDFRDLYRRGSGLSLRRLDLLIRALPPDAPLWGEVREAQEHAKTSVERNRERLAHYQRQKEAAS